MKRILIIDDEAQIRMMLKQLLEREGYDVRVAENGKEGLSLFQQYAPHLVITDIIMPEKEGVETIIELIKQNPGVHIIAISGGGRKGPDLYLKIAEKMGASKIFSKPVDRREMIDTVRDLLDQSF